MHLRIRTWAPVRDLEAGMRLARTQGLPTWQRLKGYRMCCVLHSPEEEAVLFATFWHREEDEAASSAAMGPVAARLAQVWPEARNERAAYEVAVFVRAAIQPQAGALARSIEWDGVDPENEIAIIQDWEGGLLPMFQRLTGFQGAMLATNADTGRALGMSFWEDQVSFTAARPGARKVVAEFVERHGLRQRSRVTYRLLLTDVPSGVVL
jgi:hypothetical protein